MVYSVHRLLLGSACRNLADRLAEMDVIEGNVKEKEGLSIYDYRYQLDVYIEWLGNNSWWHAGQGAQRIVGSLHSCSLTYHLQYRRSNRFCNAIFMCTLPQHGPPRRSNLCRTAAQAALLLTRFSTCQLLQYVSFSSRSSF